MSLEEFKIIDAKTLPISKLITMIARGNTIYLNHHLEDFEINATQLHLLFEISHQCDINQEKIAERCNINKGSVARSIRKLEEKELITRQIDDANRRQNKISLTAKGEDVLKESIELLNQWESKVFNDNIIEKEALQNALKEILINTIELNMEDKNGKK